MIKSTSLSLYLRRSTLGAEQDQLLDTKIALQLLMKAPELLTQPLFPKLSL